MQLNRAKFKALIHYICDKCAEDPGKLGKVKLNKVPWHVDMASYKLRGEPVTGETYRKGQFGPVAQHLLEIVEELRREGAIAVRGVEYYGHEKFEYLSLRRPDIALFDPNEIDLINEMIRYVCDENTAASISARTHDRIWEMSGMDDIIPYHTAFARAGELTPDDMVWARSEARRLGNLR